MTPPEKYHTQAIDANVDACYAAIRPLYDQYSVHDIAEAHYRIRKQLDMIAEVQEKRRRIQRLTADLEDQDIAE